jgi:hypothetical protein
MLGYSAGVAKEAIADGDVTLQFASDFQQRHD